MAPGLKHAVQWNRHSLVKLQLAFCYMTVPKQQKQGERRDWGHLRNSVGHEHLWSAADQGMLWDP